MALVSAVSSVNRQLLYAEFAVRDHKGHIIADTYVTHPELSAAISAISGNTEAISAVSAVLEDEIRSLSAETYGLVSAETERAVGAETSLATDIGNISGALDELADTVTDFDGRIDAISASLEKASANRLDWFVPLTFILWSVAKRHLPSAPLVSKVLPSQVTEVCFRIAAPSS